MADRSTETKTMVVGKPASGADRINVETPPSSVAKDPIESKIEKSTNNATYPSNGNILLVMFSVYISSFLIALDKTILSTAVPRITDQFNALNDIGWYASAYMLTLCSFQLIWGRIYTLYSPKPVFLSAIFIFEIGSAVCGAAPSSIVFIIGRAIAGMGSAGMMNGSIVIVMHTVPLAKRPIYQGLIGAVFGVASVIGPLLGGVFTEKASWRWCFYINLPCGAIVVTLLVFFLHLPHKQSQTTRSILQQLAQLDPLGTLFFLPSITSLLLALQWGGTSYPWSNWRIILLFILFPILLTLFLLTQHFRTKTATLPLRILRNRDINFSLLFTLTSQSSMLVLTYFIPLFFQSLLAFTPISSGLATLPTILSLVIGTIVAGALVHNLGYPAPLMYASVVLSAIGAGLISSWSLTVSRASWIGYQVLFGLGIGVGMQQPSMMAQIVLPREDVPVGIGLMFFAQNLGGAVWICVAQSLFVGKVVKTLGVVPGLEMGIEELGRLGATKWREVIPEEWVEIVMEGYWEAIRRAFWVGVALAGVSVIGAAGVRWRSVKEEEKGMDKRSEKHGVGA